MIIQQTFKNQWPTIYLVSTPIGNLDDMNFRAIETLKNVDVIFCEDTRTSKVLLDKYKINNKLISLHKFNEKNRVDEITELLSKDQNIAFISDAGVPIISDPGAIALNQLRKNLDLKFNITAIGVGPAYIHALISTGFISKTNYFYGFLNQKNQISKTEELKDLIDSYSSETIITFYESVHRIKDTINQLATILNDNDQVAIVRELTKINEEIVVGTIKEVNDFVNSSDFVQKGEFVIVIDQIKHQDYEINESIIFTTVEEYLIKGFKLSQASSLVAEIYKLKKNDVYSIYLDQKQKNISNL